jgi:hypothetical protein
MVLHEIKKPLHNERNDHQIEEATHSMGEIFASYPSDTMKHPVQLSFQKWRTERKNRSCLGCWYQWERGRYKERV